MTNSQALEAAIDHAALWLATAETPEKRREAWQTLTELHAQRAPERVQEMERELGLA